MGQSTFQETETKRGRRNGGNGVSVYFCNWSTNSKVKYSDSNLLIYTPLFQSIGSSYVRFDANLVFQKMISPILLQILFWAGIGGVFYGTYVLIILDHWAWWIALVFGSLLTRVIFERAILSFRAYDRLDEIASLLKKSNPTME